MFSDIWFSLVTLCCTLWLTWLFITNIFNWAKARPPLPPGPKGLPIVGMLPFLEPQLHTYFARLARTHGPFFSLRLGYKTIVIVSSPLVAKQLLKDFDVVFANHDTLVSAKEFAYGGIDLTFSPHGPEWRMLRKVSVSGMLGPAVVDAVTNLRKQWLNKTMLYIQGCEGQPINIGEQIFIMVLNMITSMLWGGTVRGTKWVKEGAEFRKEVIKLVDLFGEPNVSDFFPWLARFDLQRVAKRMRESTKRLDAMVTAVINERKEVNERKGERNHDDDNKKDFLQFLLELKDKGDSKTQLSMNQLKALLIDMIIAGTDTNSNTVDFTMLELIKNPEVMRKAQQELEEVVGAGNQVEESHIQQLTYLHAIMKETLRLHPVLPFLVPRSSSRSCVVGGYTIPKGTAVFVNVWAIQRDPSVWENPLEFKPERFMDKKHDFSGNDFRYFPFGTGRRICVGIPMTERIIMLSLASLLHYFDWELPNGVEELDFSVKFGFTLKKTVPLLLIPSPRSSNVGGDHKN